jgi:amino acid transporter
VIRIFFTLAVFSLVCTAAALLLGIQVGDLHGVLDLDTPEAVRETTIERASVHRRAGVAAAIVVIFANSLAVTYFIGTSRWCKEVVASYALDTELLRRSVALKRRTFPWAVSSMLVIVGVVTLGASADPGTGMENTIDWVLPHFLGSLAALAFLVLSFFVQAFNIRAHYEVINDIMAEVRRVREERGLAV